MAYAGTPNAEYLVRYQTNDGSGPRTEDLSTASGALGGIADIPSNPLDMTVGDYRKLVQEVVALNSTFDWQAVGDSLNDPEVSAYLSPYARTLLLEAVATNGQSIIAPLVEEMNRLARYPDDTLLSEIYGSQYIDAAVDSHFFVEVGQGVDKRLTTLLWDDSTNSNSDSNTNEKSFALKSPTFSLNELTGNWDISKDGTNVGASSNSLDEILGTVGSVVGDAIVKILSSGDGIVSRLVDGGAKISDVGEAWELGTKTGREYGDIVQFAVEDVFEGRATVQELDRRVDNAVKELIGGIVGMLPGGEAIQGLFFGSRNAAYDDRFLRASASDSFSAGSRNSDITFEIGTSMDVQGTAYDDRFLLTSRNDKFSGGDGRDALFGLEGDDTLDGGAGADIISGGGGADFLIGGTGNDTLHGSSGIDTAVYSGSQSNHTLVLSKDGISVLDRRDDGDGVDQVSDIEVLKFMGAPQDETFDIKKFASTTSLSDLQFQDFIELYIAYFNRAPDAVGLNFWGTAFANGITLEEIATQFIDQDETRATYPASLSNADFATAVYNNVLGRVPDQAGFDFWVGVLDSGAKGRDQFILSVLDGVQDGSSDRMYLNNKIDVGAYFAIHKGMSDVANASAVMALYDGTQAGIVNAAAAIDGFYADALDPSSGEFLMQLVGVLDDPFAVI